MADSKYIIAIDDLEVENVELFFTHSNSILFEHDYYDRETHINHWIRLLRIEFCGDLVEGNYNFKCSGHTTTGIPKEVYSKDIQKLPAMKVKHLDFRSHSFYGVILLEVGKFPKELKSIEKRVQECKASRIQLTEEERNLLKDFFTEKLANHKYYAERTEGSAYTEDFIPIAVKDNWESKDEGMNIDGGTTSIKGLEGIKIYYDFYFYLANRGLIQKINNLVEETFFPSNIELSDEEYDEGFDESQKRTAWKYNNLLG